MGGLFLAMQVVFVDLVVDAARRDPEQTGGLRLIAVGFVQSSFEQEPFAILEGAREVPAVEV